MAMLLNEFLPGSGSAAWKNHVSYQSIARDLRLERYWPGGTKVRAIETLLGSTLEREPTSFEPLLKSVVKHSMSYRERRGDPLQRSEIDTLNGLLLEVGFKLPDLWDPRFLDALTVNNRERAAEVARSFSSAMVAESGAPSRTGALMEFRDRFFALCGSKDRPAAGLALEKLLNDVFDHFSLQPRASFRVEGEQIDGSFVLDFETYLAEAKWTAERVPAADLYVFREKVEGKSAATRGVFLSINGFSEEAVPAITHGKQPLFFLMDGPDLLAVLQDQIELPELLRLKQRRLAEGGRVMVSARDLFASRTA